MRIAYLLRFLCCLFVPAAVLLCTSAPARAQPSDVGGTWTTLTGNLAALTTSGFPLETRRTVLIHFFDTLRGYRIARMAEASGSTRARDTAFRTTDGGRSWAPVRVPSPSELPYETFADGSAYHSDGRTSTDRGYAWQPGRSGLRGFTMEPGGYQCGLVSGSPATLVISSDGGASWSEDITPTLGPLPSDPGLASSQSAMVELLRIRGNVLHVLGTATGRLGQDQVALPFVGRIDLAARTSSWQRLPFWIGRTSPDRGPARLRVLDDRVMIADEWEYEPFYGNYGFRALWRTTDGGVTWSRNSDLTWVDITTLEFFSSSFGVSSSARTTDGGATWTRRGAPFSGVAFDAIDSSTYLTVMEPSILALTTDAGSTWRRSTHPGRALSMAANVAGAVLIAREGRSVLRTLDSGTTWIDAGRGAGFPEGIARLAALTFPEPSGRPEHVVGVGGVVTPDGQQRAHIVESVDTGRTWRLGTRLKALDANVFDEALFHEPIVMRVAPGEDNVGTTIFISGIHGVYRQNGPNGYDLIVDASEVQTLHMADDQHGVKLAADWWIPALRILATSDGGRSWQHAGYTPDGFTFSVSLAFTGDGYRAIVSGSWGDYREWVVSTSPDGLQWNHAEYRYDLPHMKGGEGYWLDARRLYVVARGASILYSSDAGSSFQMLHDTTAGFFIPRRNDNYFRNDSADVYFRPLLSAFDGARIYVANREMRVGRWTPGLVPTNVPSGQNACWIDLVATPEELFVRGSDPAGDQIELSVFDLTGRRVLTGSLDSRGGRISTAHLPGGAYLVAARVCGQTVNRIVSLVR